MLGSWHNTQITRIESVNEKVRRFWVRFEQNEPFNFIPGQFMTFDLPIAEKKHARLRSYSIASAPNGTNEIEFVISLLEGGLGTTYLFNQAAVGTPLAMRGPLGHFSLKPNHIQQGEVCFICTGTGIAPFRSMLWNIHNTGQTLAYPIHLIYGTRMADNLLYYDEMQQLTQLIPNFQYHAALSRQDVPNNPAIKKGYVHSIYEAIYAQKQPANFYLCGWNNMLDEAQKRLQEMGYEKQNIIYESYG
ncbi:MAG: FAD-dependent oxidoreductase [Sphingobacteriales bacterium]|jgi:ferredoxin-NADP reductase|nr:FAD-dependent oxidoreductase [Sphingobacteriales bacterium]MBP9142476.1 FAD-dependent oxidoreductase [Chitinophagales bacterium]MDA0199397.1 FAD-dependent oxidoreductase [Bacteroidota bacterium]MBK6890141.1 FAD-dependent oxidoreductase [Sphingobacteriales bacterium]MBK7527332.1 FAD-dependent oxidoreductase [Sphingobacteriales bacterium]